MRNIEDVEKELVETQLELVHFKEQMRDYVIKVEGDLNAERPLKAVLHAMLDEAGVRRGPPQDERALPILYSVPKRVAALIGDCAGARAAEAHLRAVHMVTVGDNTALRKRIDDIARAADEQAP